MNAPARTDQRVLAAARHVDLTAAKARLDAVMSLHQRLVRSLRRDVCVECRQTWPCRTARIVRGDR